VVIFQQVSTIILCIFLDHPSYSVQAPKVNLNMEAIHSSKILVTAYKSTWCHKTEDIFSAMRTSNLRLFCASSVIENRWPTFCLFMFSFSVFLHLPFTVSRSCSLLPHTCHGWRKVGCHSKKSISGQYRACPWCSVPKNVVQVWGMSSLSFHFIDNDRCFRL
jgi:hypothetical protein